MPGALRTRSLAWKIENTRVSHHGRAGIARHSRTRMVLTVSFALFPEIGLVVSVIGAMREHCRQLDVSVETSEPHDFAVRFGNFVCVAQASTASRAQRS
jgi:hypothetical protein